MTIRTHLDALATCSLSVPASAQRWLDVAATLEQERDAEAERTALNAHHFIENITTDNAAAMLDEFTAAKLEAETRELLARQLIESANAKAEACIRAEADALIGMARKGFDKAVRQLTTDAGMYDPADSTEAVLRRGPDVAAAWGRVQDVSATLDQHLALWSALYGSRQTVDAVVKSYDEDHWRRVDADALFTGANRWHALAAAGYPLQLNTAAETAALIAATPERDLRAERGYVEGFLTTQTVRG